MKKIDPGLFSKTYTVRDLCADDIEMIYTFCKSNTQYYRYCGKSISTQVIERDMKVTPPGIPMEQKYYVGFFENGGLIAVMDLIDGYPSSEYAFIGFFMVNIDFQGRGIGSGIIAELFDFLQSRGFQKCRLGIDKTNPQALRFWQKNGFEIVREALLPEGIVLVAERTL